MLNMKLWLSFLLFLPFFLSLFLLPFLLRLKLVCSLMLLHALQCLCIGILLGQYSTTVSQWVNRRAQCTLNGANRPSTARDMVYLWQWLETLILLGLVSGNAVEFVSLILWLSYLLFFPSSSPFFPLFSSPPWYLFMPGLRPGSKIGTAIVIKYLPKLLLN